MLGLAGGAPAQDWGEDTALEHRTPPIHRRRALEDADGPRDDDDAGSRVNVIVIKDTLTKHNSPRRRAKLVLERHGHAMELLEHDGRDGVQRLVDQLQEEVLRVLV